MHPYTRAPYLFAIYPYSHAHCLSTLTTAVSLIIPTHMCFWLTLAGTSNCTDKMSNCPDFEKNGKCPDRARCPHAHPIAPKNLADEMKSAADPPAAANVGDPGSRRTPLASGRPRKRQARQARPTSQVRQARMPPRRRQDSITLAGIF